jgi:zinc transport system substrate-binding protein
MKKILLLLTLTTTFIFANLKVVASIAPVMSYIEAIGKDRVDTTLMVEAGASPHTYEPKPSQMVAITMADLYFAIGVEFENIWLDKFHSLNSCLEVVHLDSGIKKLYMSNLHTKNAKKDPHIWTSPTNIETIATNIYKALVKADSKNSDFYKKNYDDFIAHIEEVKKEIKSSLKDTPKGSKFMVFHPSWGYFANEFGLKQIPIEIEGKKPKPQELLSILKEAKRANIKAIFTQPEFSDATARVISSELNIDVIKVSPLAKDWETTLLKIANAIGQRD